MDFNIEINNFLINNTIGCLVQYLHINKHSD